MENSCPTVMPGLLITKGSTPDQMTLSLFISLSQPVQTNTHAHTQLAVPVKIQSVAFPF